VRAAGGTTIATVISPPNAGVDNDFVLSVRESPGNGSGAGADLFAEHWHRLPCELGPPLQQQEHGPFAPQQLPYCAEDAAAPPQQEGRGLDTLVQCGHLTASAASARPDFTAIDCGE